MEVTEIPDRELEVLDRLEPMAEDVSQFDPARNDDVAYDYFRTGSGTPVVFFLIDFGSFSAELPITVFTPGTGVACLNPATLISAGFAIGSADEAFNVLSFPVGPLRASLVGFPLVQQAMEFDVATSEVHAGPCGRQTF